MPDQPRRRRRLSRLFAPLALVAVAAALAGVVINSNVVNGDEGDGGERTTERTSTGAEEQNDRPRQRTRARYTIKTGDTLGGIAEKTGVSVERLEALNPELDPQALVAGQRIKLRE